MPEADKTFQLNCDRLPYNALIGAHRHYSLELDFIQRGYGIHIFNGVPESAAEGELILIPSGVVHNWLFDRASADSAGRVVTYTLLFNPDIISSRFKVFPELQNCLNLISSASHPIEIRGDNADRVKKALLEMVNQDDSHRLSSFISILADISDSSCWRIIHSGDGNIGCERVQSIIQRVYKFLLDNYTRHISLDEVASVACMNRSAFCTFFKKHYSQSFQYVLNEHRIHIACLLICESPDRNIADIAISVGFNDVPHFHRTFKKLKGCSPLHYRRQMSAASATDA